MPLFFQKMKKYISKRSRFNLILPVDWTDYDDGDDSDAFFNESNWSGNLRVTFLNLSENDASEIISNELLKNEKAIAIVLDRYQGVHYKEVGGIDLESLIYYWIIGQSNELFICSFTIDKINENTQSNFFALKTAESIVNSIQVI